MEQLPHLFEMFSLRKNTISSRNTMYLYERMPRAETGTSQVQIVVQ
ncbi:MAG TPA: hypothetical protein VE402_01835 [Candidatus Angelobacter sp.]|nr:hypothetical protein [Candidatus Angelobacter sp.]